MAKDEGKSFCKPPQDKLKPTARQQPPRSQLANIWERMGVTLQIRQVLNTTNKIKNIIRKQHPKVAIGKYIEADGGDIANTASAEKLQAATWKVTA